MKRRLTSLLILPLILLATAQAQPPLTGEVVGISDGDTLTLLTPGKEQKRILLAEIDTPESKQPYGTRSRQALSALVFRQQVRVEVVEIDRYGRTVGRVYRASDGLDVNAELVRQGAAWVYRQYNRDKSLLALEREAQAAKRGLWSLPEAERMPPWEWRRAERQERAASRSTAAPTSQPVVSGFSCGTKRTCGEMSSCAEARFYLNSCGLQRLDRDRDGVPCEKLCR